MSQPIVLVTGANGQVGKELKALHGNFPQFRFVFASREDLKLHHFGLVENYFIGLRPQYCINCAAYTAVDKAESEADMAFLVNGEAVGNLAAVCRTYHTQLIHLSTDYVFDGEQEQPYRTDDATGPVSVYGRSKLLGEQRCRAEAPDSLIIRTAWVYSEFGNNFVKTMLRLMHERPAINVVNDQVGAPTYAADLAGAVLHIIASGTWEPGIYHYSNKGRISWYDFAVAIRNAIGSACVVNPIPTSDYPTPARRPRFSLLDCSRIEEVYGLRIPDWNDSLLRCLHRLEVLPQQQ
ncbi:MAG TPA: dTDP-4-dehydrorhamnose reductase [Lacibacter sp.]|nr:dTDP-4-dehydrorhamnose reductase [Lacibacter sp.]HMO89509.1 dTDP-4-dehydrorhamnose reductase [Lacibacter sp.]HMP86842.1 dTDP-4-dehydrorhamnose reductase [Lacibacter sp.]